MLSKTKTVEDVNIYFNNLIFYIRLEKNIIKPGYAVGNFLNLKAEA